MILIIFLVYVWDIGRKWLFVGTHIFKKDEQMLIIIQAGQTDKQPKGQNCLPNLCYYFEKVALDEYK